MFDKFVFFCLLNVAQVFSKIIDQRIGKDGMIDDEECISKRFTAERLKIFKATDLELVNNDGKFFSNNNLSFCKISDISSNMKCFL